MVEINAMLKNLKDKKSACVDGILSEALNASSTVKSSILVKMIILSKQQGKLLDCSKIAKVIPFIKSGDPCVLNNYRPNSVLTVSSKVLNVLSTIEYRGPYKI